MLIAMLPPVSQRVAFRQETIDQIFDCLLINTVHTFSVPTLNFISIFTQTVCFCSLSLCIGACVYVCVFLSFRDYKFNIGRKATPITIIDCAHRM